MADHVIKQPDGRFAIFSTSVDDFTHYNLVQDDVIQELAKLGIERGTAEQKLNHGIEDRNLVEFGEKGSGLDRWKACTESVRSTKGKRALERFLALIER